MALLETDLTVDYPGKPGVLRDLGLAVDAGEILGLVGESGSGKSTLALALLGLLDFKRGVARGHVRFEGRELLGVREREFRQIRGNRIALVLQNAHASLNPVMRIGAHFKEAWRAHSHTDHWQKAGLPLLKRVCLPADESFLNRHPADISTGQAQRVLIALALLHRPALVIADEPTSALDVVTQQEVAGLFREINRDLGVAILMISHDLLSVASLCSRIAILEKGEIVESGATRTVFEQPLHPYTKRLLNALPLPDWMRDRDPALRAA